MSDRLRAIDALIAEHLFGLKKHADVEFSIGQGWYSPDKTEQREWMPGDEGPRWGVLPDYSSDPAASKHARDKAGALGFKWALAFDGMKYIAYCGKDGYAAPEGEREGASEAESFAIALLAALQIAVPE